MRNSGDKAPVIGIDLGTSNCCMALWNQGSMEIIRNTQGERLTPSVVSLHSGDNTKKIVVGAPARRQAVMNPTQTISEVKRLIGQRFTSTEVVSAREILPYAIVEATNGDAWVQLNGQPHSPQEIQAYILEELVLAASHYVGMPIELAVITVPAFFDETQRQAVKDSAAIAGIKISRILSEPTAAALSYGYMQMDKRRIAVIDLGGGTLDVTVMSVDRGRFVVLATDGDNVLGGADFDRCIAKYFSEVLFEEQGVRIGTDPVAMQRLLEAAESAKKSLTEQSSVDIHLPFLAQNGATPVDFRYQLTTKKYEELVAPLVDRIEAPCSAAVAQAGLRLTELDDVILIGGMTRSPIVNKRIGTLFQRRPLLRVNPDEAVAMGAALLGASISGIIDEVGFVDVVPRTVGLRAAGDVYIPLIHKSSRLPARCKKGFKTTRDNQDSFELDILQGEAPVASQNRRLSHITISPISHKPAGQVFLELTIEMDATGSLCVYANERGASEQIQVVIEPFSGLTQNQVANLAAQHANSLKAESQSNKDTPEATQGGFSMTLKPSSGTSTQQQESAKHAALRRRQQADEKLKRAKEQAVKPKTGAALPAVQFTPKPAENKPAIKPPSQANAFSPSEASETTSVHIKKEAAKRIPKGASEPLQANKKLLWLAAAIVVIAISTTILFLR